MMRNGDRAAAVASPEAGGSRHRGRLDREDVEARGGMYRFLSAVYLRPLGPSLLRQLASAQVLNDLARLVGEVGVTELRMFAAGLDGDLDGRLPALEQEFMELFAVPTGRYVTPFEDVYQGVTADGRLQRGPLLGHRAIAVKRLYREAGAEMDRACRELPTHIGVELAFMSFLCEREAAALRDEEDEALADPENGAPRESSRYRELQLRFLQEHLTAWAPQLCDAIGARAASGVYRGVARLTQEFLAHDAGSLVASSR